MSSLSLCSNLSLGGETTLIEENEFFISTNLSLGVLFLYANLSLGSETTLMEENEFYISQY